MLTHAFEALGAIRVEFKTDLLNRQSRAALTRLGATEEGIFRNHMITASGRVRHSVWFVDRRQRVAQGEAPARGPAGAEQAFRPSMHERHGR